MVVMVHDTNHILKDSDLSSSTIYDSKTVEPILLLRRYTILTNELSPQVLVRTRSSGQKTLDADISQEINLVWAVKRYYRLKYKFLDDADERPKDKQVASQGSGNE